MGNRISKTKVNENKTCLICWENINSQSCCECIHCNIFLHNLCAQLYRGDN